jgi:hypothetical protein
MDQNSTQQDTATPSDADRVRSEKIESLAARARAVAGATAKPPKAKKEKPGLDEAARAAVSLLAALPLPLLEIAMRELRGAAKEKRGGADAETAGQAEGGDPFQKTFEPTRAEAEDG